MLKNDVYRIRKEVAFRKAEDGTVTIVSPVTDKIITINNTAAEIWDMIDQGVAVDSIIEKFILLHKNDNNFPCISDVRKDIVDTIEDFFERKLIEISGGK